MAKRTQEKKEAKGWRTKTLAEWAPSETVTWKAQLSISPDDKKFRGVRKYVVKKDGTEIITKTGLSFLQSETTKDEIREVITLLKSLIKE
jgi:hypothetical protein